MMSKRWLVFGIFIGLFTCQSITGTVYAKTKANISMDGESIISQKTYYTGVLNCYNTEGGSGGLVDSIRISDFDAKTGDFFVVYDPIVKKIGDASVANTSCFNLFVNNVSRKLVENTAESTRQKEIVLENNFYSATQEYETTSSYCYQYKFFTAREEEEYSSSAFGSWNTAKTIIPSLRRTGKLCIEKDDDGKYLTSYEASDYDENERIGFTTNSYKPIVFEGVGTGTLKITRPRQKNRNANGGKSAKTITVKLNDGDFENESQILATVGNYFAELMGGSAASGKYLVNEWNGDFNADIATVSDAIHYTDIYYAGCTYFVPNSDNSGIVCNATNVPEGGRSVEGISVSDPAYYNGNFTDEIPGGIAYNKINLIYEPVSRWDSVVDYFSKGTFSTYDQLKLSDDEIYTLYYYYLINVYGVSESSITCGEGPQYGVGNYNARLWWTKENKYSEYCYFTVDSDKMGIKVYGVYDDHFFGKVVSLEELIDQQDSLDLDDPPSLGGIVRTGGSVNSDDNQACYTGSGPVGWILCPVIQGLTGLGNSIWKDVEQNHLKTPSKAIFDSSGGVKAAWETVRNIGNTVFIILFMIVIFSQLTGVGIDNYGIKKILPKLILVAILTNLSWIICELAVDLSNIIGMSINDMLTGMAPVVEIASEDGRKTFAATAWITEIALAGGGIALFAWLNPIGLVSAAFAVLGVILSIVAAIAVMYVILLIREAGIVLLIVLAPVAIVGYALPNTEKLAKKWFNLFKALLIVYPLCGLVMGGGKLAGAILAGVDPNNTGLRLAAMIIQVLPFFLIPMLLKNSLALMGNIGSRISQTGKRLGRGASNFTQRSVQNSKGYKNWAQVKQDKADLRGANRRSWWDKQRTSGGLKDKKEREEYRKLADKVRNNTATDAEKERFKQLREKSTYKPSDTRMRRLSEDNNRRRQVESERDKAKYGADALVAAGLIESDKYSNRKSAEEALDWNEEYFVDNDGNTWVSDRNGNYSTVDKDGVRRTESASNIAARVRNNEGEMVSKRTAMLNRDNVSRDRQSGQLAGYANQSRTEAAARGARLSSIESSHAELLQGAQSGKDHVLQVQHDDNVSKRNELTGRALANAEFRAQGFDTTTSVEAARQAAEGRLTNVIAQNNAAEDYVDKISRGEYTREYVDKDGNKHKVPLTRRELNERAVGTATNKQISQKTNEVAGNVAGAIQTNYDVAMTNARSRLNLEKANNNMEVTSEISKQYAQSLAKQRFDTSQEKMYAEQMAGMDKMELLSNFVGAVAGLDAEKNPIKIEMTGGVSVEPSKTGVGKEGLEHAGDLNFIRAAMKGLIAQGGMEEFSRTVGSKSFSDATSGPQKAGIAKTINSYMATMSAEPEAKVFGKTASKVKDGETAQAYHDWLLADDKPLVDDSGNVVYDDKGRVKYSDTEGKASLRGYSRVAGDNALVDASKDTVKFYDSDSNLRGAFNLTQAAKAMAHAKNTDTRLALENFTKNMINDTGGFGDWDRTKEEYLRAIDHLTDAEWTTMEGSGLSALLGGRSFAELPADLRNHLSMVKARLDKTSGTVKANMRKEVRDFFDAVPSAPKPGSNGPNPTPAPGPNPTPAPGPGPSPTSNPPLDDGGGSSDNEG